MRNYSFLDNVISQIDSGLRALSGNYDESARKNPANDVDENDLSKNEKKHAARLMRINHVGEVCAQALYQGQALTARSKNVKEKMQHCAQEEVDHLAWCHDRLSELSSHTSYLNPVWYVGALTIGVAAGLAGDKWNLGFVEETENQVVKHLESHFEKLPEKDLKSLTIVKQMHEDEAKHANTAKRNGAAELPLFIKKLMQFSAKIMTTTAYYV